MLDKDRVKKYNINIYANMHGGGKICRHVNTLAGFGGGQSRGVWACTSSLHMRE